MQSTVRVRVEKDLIITVSRNLKGKGKIKVSLGQEVSPDDILGSSLFSPGFRTLNLSKSLSVDPSQIEKYLKKSLGEKVYKGELLAQRKTFLGGERTIVSPSDGILDFINSKTGEVRMTSLPKKEDLPSGFYGIVEGIDNGKGQIVIKTQASLVHGMFGSGKIRDGILRIVSKRDEFFTGSQVSQEYAEQILLGGSLVYKNAISAAISAGVNGIIAGGINAEDYKQIVGGRFNFPKKLDNDIGISIVICEGFGPVSLGWDIIDALKEYEEKFISIDGNRGIIYLPSFEGSSMAKIRSTNLKMANYDPSDYNTSQLKKGMAVRITGNSFLGEQGKIIALDKEQTLLPSGIKAYLATVETKKRKIKIPVDNIEIIV